MIRELPVGRHRPDEPAPKLATLMELLQDSPYHDELADPARRRSQLYEALAGSDDPMWREIGEQLRDGQMRLRHVLETTTYWQHLKRGLAERQDEFPRVLAALQARLEAEHDQRRRAE